MKIKFLGAVEHVTGSCTLLHYPRTGIEFLVDCGQVQGEPNASTLNARPWPFVPKNLSFVLLTHAHLDHCGLVPRLYKDGFKGKVICTRFTGELAILNLEDAVKHEGVPFDIDDVRDIRFEYLDDRDGFGFSKRLPIANDLFVSFLRSAHIGGACSISISWMSTREAWSEIHFSGDVGNNRKDNCYQSILASRQTPLGFPRHIVLESTYGDRTRDIDFANYEKRIEALSLVVRESLRERSGPIVIPCFSIHRTQEILVDLHVVLEQLSAQEAVCSEGRPLLQSPEIIDKIVCDGLQARHIEGKKSLISQWSPEQQKEWLSWFTRVPGGVDGESEPIFLPRDQAAETIAVVREKLGMLRKRQQRLFKVVVDSPLAIKVCEVYARELKRRKKKKPTEPLYRNRELAERLGLDSEESLDALLDKMLTRHPNEKTTFGSYVLSIEAAGKQSGKIPLGSGTIVVTGGGMCEGGPVIEHLKTLLPNEGVTVLLTGYAPQNSIAGKLRAFPQMPEERRLTESLDLFDKKISYASIKATISDIGPYYSGHADQVGLVDYLFELRANPEIERHPARVFLNHGDDRKRIPLAEAIRARSAIDGPVEQRRISGIEIPKKDLQWFDLESDAWVEEAPDADTLRPTGPFHEMLIEQRRTNELLAQLIQMLTK